MGGQAGPADAGRADRRRPSRPPAEIKRDLDAVVEEYQALLAKMKREADAERRRVRRGA